MASKKKALKITRRLVNSKRHTTGYVIGGKKTTVPAARQLALQGRLSNVRVVGRHIQGVPGNSLATLPVTIV